jgi:hypothetical protein|tara:strand:- start:675 stop:1166 length:492 start_codon:yes stop_codon:yes gene_type:complete
VIVKNKLHEDVLAWEIEVKDLNIDVENLDYKLQDGSLFNKITTRFENHEKHLKNKILSLLDVSYIKEKVPEYKKIDIKIFKDIPGFKLVPHSDRQEHKAFIMINLINNVNSTSFYDINKNFLCEGSGKKNSGIFHLLHTRPHIMHAIENTSNKNRYTTIAFIK